MAQIKIQIKGLRQLQRALERYPKIAAPHIQKAIGRSLLRIERVAKQKAPKDTGRLVGHEWMSLQPLSGKLEPRVDYAAAVHEGTRPHWPNWRPGSPLADWSRRHGIEPYLVARAISRKGTKARPFLREAVEGNVRQVETEFEIALDATMRDIARQVNTI